MSSIIFNNFKKRFLKGNVPANDEWYFIPVNNKFINTYDTTKMPLEQYRNVDDFMKTNSSVFFYDSPQDAIQYTHDQMAISSDNFNYKISAMSGEGLLSGSIIEKTWSKVLDDETLSNQPMFINSKNYETFKEYYYESISSNDSIDDYISSGGFYYIRSKDELTWFADKTNKSNNRLIGVIGDTIEGKINGDSIGKDELYPFEGILDGNGFSLKNIELDCSNTDNGIVGVLGKFGIVKNFNVIGNTTLTCNKKINLKHLKSDARDINAGILVGRNYGKIYNIRILNNNTYLNGFIPEVYSVTNKSDDYTWSDGKVRQKWNDGNENFYFLNSWCINSPGNICPYVGYFAEGYYGEDIWGATRYYQINNQANEIPLSADWAISISGLNNKKFDLLDDIIYEKNDWNGIYYQPLNAYNYNKSTNEYDGIGLGNRFNTDRRYYDKEYYEILKNDILNLCKLPLYMGVDKDHNYTTCILNNTLAKNKTNEYTNLTAFWPNPVTAFRDAFGGSNICYNANIIKNVYKNKIDAALKNSNVITATSSYFPYCPSAYCQTSLRMSPMVRAAYNIGGVAGANYGTISSIYLSTTIINQTNFVGFIGGIAGKQGIGELIKVHSDIKYDLNYKPIDNDNSYNVVYKQTPLLPKNLRPSYYITATNQADPDIPISAEHCNADLIFSSFYDKDPTVDINKDITDDCIIYKLKPIFIAGGLFGRYIPSQESGFENEYSTAYRPAGCTVSASEVVMYSNYGHVTVATDQKSADISIETTFGALAGKIDYETTNVDLSTENDNINNVAIRVYDSFISAAGDFGNDVKLKPYVLSSTTGLRGTYNTYVYSGTATSSNSSRRYVGIYELKYNPCNSLVLATRNRKIPYYSEYEVAADGKAKPIISSYGDDILPTGDTALTGDDTGYLFISDLPFITNYASGGPNASFWANWNLTNNMASGNESNDGLNIPYGYNKRNIAHDLVRMNNCSASNITPLVLLYDDFFNNWGDTADDSYNNLYLNVYHSKKFNVRNLFGTSMATAFGYSYAYTDFKYFSNENEGKGMVCNVYNDVYGLKPYTATNGTVSCMTFNSGYQINGMEIAGIQNSFDGYTFIRTETQPAYAADNQLHTVILNTNEFNKFYEYATLDGETKYHNPRIFEKNIMVYKSMHLTPYNYNLKDWYYMGELPGTLQTNPGLTYTDSHVYSAETAFVNTAVLSHVQEEDKYFYYTYDITNTDTIKYDTMQNIDDNGLIGKHAVSFNIEDGKMYYSIKDMNNKTKYTIGDYLTPTEIRETLNKQDNFTTTSVSSNDDFAGLLVVDSSGRNVMFMENVNNVPLTGNSVSFNIETQSNSNNLNILEVK